MFSFFAQFWIFAFFLHHSEDWNKHSLVVISMLLVIWVNSAKDRAKPFLASLIFHFSYCFYGSPRIANHSNFYMVVSLFMLLWMIYIWIKNKELTEAILIKEFKGVRSILCLSLVVVYFMAGFHKFNFDFFNLDVSCATNFFNRYAREYSFSADYIPDVLLQASPYLVLFFEIVGAILLLVPRLQIFGLLAFLSLHTYLSPLSFYDFASICYSILLCFLPFSIYQGDVNRSRLQKAMNFMIYFSIFGSLLSLLLIDYNYKFLIKYDVFQSWFFILGSSYFIFRLYQNLKESGYRVFELKGINLLDFSNVKPKWMYTMPLLLFIFAFTSYLGLRTAGNTSMFSNLRTEGGRSNHILLSSKWQPFGFQKDLVYVEHASTEGFLYRYKRQPKVGMMMTAFELRRITEIWKNIGKPVKMTIHHNGERKRYDDITVSSEWGQNPLPWILKKTMLFRTIQPEGPNSCRW